MAWVRGVVRRQALSEHGAAATVPMARGAGFQSAVAEMCFRSAGAAPRGPSCLQRMCAPRCGESNKKRAKQTYREDPPAELLAPWRAVHGTEAEAVYLRERSKRPYPTCCTHGRRFCLAAKESFEGEDAAMARAEPFRRAMAGPDIKMDLALAGGDVGTMAPPGTPAHRTAMEALAASRAVVGAADDPFGAASQEQRRALVKEELAEAQGNVHLGAVWREVQRGALLPDRRVGGFEGAGRLGGDSPAWCRAKGNGPRRRGRRAPRR